MTGIPKRKCFSSKFCDIMGMLQEPENFGPHIIGTKKKLCPVYGGSGCFLCVESGGLTSRFLFTRTCLCTNVMNRMSLTSVPYLFSLDPMRCRVIP